MLVCYIHKMIVVEMRILWLISGNTGKYEIWNEEISLKIGVSLIEGKKKEGKSLEIVWSYLEKSDLSWGNKKAGQIRVNQRRNKENEVG